MAVNYNFKKGIDLATWHWLNQYPQGSFFGGIANAYDGSRYIYWAIQRGSSSNGTASTTELARFDTWTNGWQNITVITSATGSLDIEYDSIRNVIWIVEASSTSSTSWKIFNLNTTSVTYAGTTVTGWTLSAAISVVLPSATATATSESALVLVSETEVPAQLPIKSDTTTSALTGAPSTTSITDSTAEYHSGMIGCYVRMDSGTQIGASRLITAVVSQTQLTVTAFGGSPAAADTYHIEVPGGLTGTALACSGTQTSSTIQASASQGWTTNFYKDADAVIVAGTGSGQRRRILSNDAQTLTLAASTTGNARTGNWSVTPDNTSTFRIIPSSDFLYYNPGNATTMSQGDVVATTMAWTSLTAMTGGLGSGGDLEYSPHYAPFSLVYFRGSGTNQVYRYDIGTRASTLLTSNWGTEVGATGGSFARVPNRARFIIHVASSQRVYIYNPVTTLLEPITTLPYSVPLLYSGKNIKALRTADGADLVYFARKGGQEYFRLPLEWL